MKKINITMVWSYHQSMTSHVHTPAVLLYHSIVLLGTVLEKYDILVSREIKTGTFKYIISI